MPNRDIIVIGGSAGAVPALKDILRRLPADLPAAICIVLHIPAQGVGILSTVATAAGQLPVRRAESGMAIENGHVYLAVPDHHLLIDDGHLVLGRGPRENLTRPAIDPLFRSAALHYGPRVIGVVLSGMLSDGAAGLGAIKRCGGIALVQDPQDAMSGEMPLRALEATTVDLCMPGARMGDVLPNLVRERPGAVLPIPPQIALEVKIAAGERISSDALADVADPAPLTCPACGSVLSGSDMGHVVRFRHQLGAHTADIASKQPEDSTDEALRFALRIIEQHAERVNRSGWPTIARMYDARRRISRICRHDSPRHARIGCSGAPDAEGAAMDDADCANWAHQLRSERRLLTKAEFDIEQGRRRLRKQQDLLERLQRAGHDTRQAEHLAGSLERTLVEWERHRGLIEQRIDYLERHVAPHESRAG